MSGNAPPGRPQRTVLPRPNPRACAAGGRPGHGGQRVGRESAGRPQPPAASPGTPPHGSRAAVGAQAAARSHGRAGQWHPKNKVPADGSTSATRRALYPNSESALDRMSFSTCMAPREVSRTRSLTLSYSTSLALCSLPSSVRRKVDRLLYSTHAQRSFEEHGSATA